MTKKIKAEIAAAPKYGLFIEGLGWLAENQDLSGVVFTEHKELARQFAEGFDDPKSKLEIWSLTFQAMIGMKDIKFEAVYL